MVGPHGESEAERVEAAMEPRPEGRGWVFSRDNRGTVPWCRNGAPARGPGMEVPVEAQPAPLDVPQWSPGPRAGDGAAEVKATKSTVTPRSHRARCSARARSG